MTETMESVAEVTASYNPATGARIGSTPLNTPEDVKEAVARAREAQSEWAPDPSRRGRSTS